MKYLEESGSQGQKRRWCFSGLGKGTFFPKGFRVSVWNDEKVLGSVG
jgi:hypothetical protein